MNGLTVRLKIKPLTSGADGQDFCFVHRITRYSASVSATRDGLCAHSLLSALGAILSTASSEFSHTMMYISILLMGMIFGLLIELTSTVAFKSKQTG